MSTAFLDDQLNGTPTQKSAVQNIDFFVGPRPHRSPTAIPTEAATEVLEDPVWRKKIARALEDSSSGRTKPLDEYLSTPG